MNYDQRFIREESLIFFIRKKEQPDTPLVTLEYSLRNHKVLQCYNATVSTTTNRAKTFCTMSTKYGFPTPTEP